MHNWSMHTHASSSDRVFQSESVENTYLGRTLCTRGVLHIVVVIVCARPGGDDNGEGPGFRRDLQNQYWHLARLRPSPRARVYTGCNSTAVFRLSNPTVTVRFGQSRTTIPAYGRDSRKKTLWKKRHDPSTTDDVRHRRLRRFPYGKTPPEAPHTLCNGSAFVRVYL